MSNNMNFEATDEDWVIEETEEEWFAGFHRSRQRLLEKLRRKDEENCLAITPVTTIPQPDTTLLPSSVVVEMKASTGESIGNAESNLELTKEFTPPEVILHPPLDLILPVELGPTLPDSKGVNTLDICIETEKGVDDVSTLKAIVTFENEPMEISSSPVSKAKGATSSVSICYTKEPCELLRGLLELRYVQKISTLTNSMNTCFEQKDKFVDTGWNGCGKIFGETVNDNLPIVQSQKPFSHGKHLIYSGGGERCNGLSHYLWSSMCAMEGKDFRLYWYRVCEGETDIVVQRPWHLVCNSRHMMDMLPINFGNPPWFTDDEIEELKGTTLYRASQLQKKKLQDIFDSKVKDLVNKLLSLRGNTARDVCFKDFLWANAIFWTRALNIPLPRSYVFPTIKDPKNCIPVETLSFSVTSVDNACAEASYTTNNYEVEEANQMRNGVDGADRTELKETVWVEGLVPDIDFCNHSLRPGATWEVDRKGSTTGIPVAMYLLSAYPAIRCKVLIQVAIVNKFNQRVKIPILSSEDRETQEDWQALLCSVLQVKTQKLSSSDDTKSIVLRAANQIMMLLFKILRFRLSNERRWLGEYKLNGFSLDDITSVMYTLHGLQSDSSQEHNLLPENDRKRSKKAMMVDVDYQVVSLTSDVENRKGRLGKLLCQLFEEKHLKKIQKLKDSIVYVKIIDDSVIEDMLRDIFSQCGIITSLKIMQDEDMKMNQGFGLVCFSNLEEAPRAVEITPKALCSNVARNYRSAITSYVIWWIPSGILHNYFNCDVPFLKPIDDIVDAPPMDEECTTACSLMKSDEERRIVEFLNKSKGNQLTVMEVDTTEEMIDSLSKLISDTEDDGIIKELLLDFYDSSGKRKPEQIVIFRGGVSKSQFTQVINIELVQIIEACKFLDEKWNLKFVFIVAQKHHNTKFFQLGAPENVPPGTIIDNKISLPSNNDSSLCAHDGIMKEWFICLSRQKIKKHSFCTMKLEEVGFNLLLVIFCICIVSLGWLPAIVEVALQLRFN